METQFSKSNSAASKIEKLRLFVQRTIESQDLSALHSLLVELSESDWNTLLSDFANWPETEQKIVSNCVAYGIDGKYDPLYTNDQRLLAQGLYFKMEKGFSHPEVEKWKKNFKVHSTTKSKNPKVLFVYELLLQHEYDDSDYWPLGGGSHEIQNRLNRFGDEDWEDLKQDLVLWSADDRDIFIESLAFGFDNLDTPCLKKELVPRAGKFLLDLFVLNIGERNEIAYFSFFIAQSDLTNIEDLEFLKSWLLANNYQSEHWINSSIHPLKNVDLALRRARDKNVN